MKELALLVFGWVFGLLTNFFTDYYNKLKRRQGIARIIREECRLYAEEMAKEVAYFNGRCSLPSINSTIYKINYSREIFDSHKDDLGLFGERTIRILTTFYYLIKIIEEDKNYIRRTIREGQSLESDFVKELFETQVSLREKANEIAVDVDAALAVEAGPLSIKRGNPRKIVMTIICVLALLILGGTGGYWIAGNQGGPSFEIKILEGGQGPRSVMIDKSSGETWLYENGRWETMTRAAAKQGK